jgi:hypothetical protein
MQGKKFVVDKTCNWEGIKTFHEEVVDFLIILVETLCSKVEELGHLSALVVPSEHVNRLGKIQLQ